MILIFIVSDKIITIATVDRKVKQLEKLKLFDGAWELYERGNIMEVYQLIAPVFLDNTNDSSDSNLFSAQSKIQLLSILYKVTLFFFIYLYCIYY